MSCWKIDFHYCDSFSCSFSTINLSSTASLSERFTSASSSAAYWSLRYGSLNLRTFLPNGDVWIVWPDLGLYIRSCDCSDIKLFADYIYGIENDSCVVILFSRLSCMAICSSGECDWDSKLCFRLGLSSSCSSSWMETIFAFDLSRVTVGSLVK